MNLCKCGCGIKVRRNYVQGHNRRGIKLSVKSIEKRTKSRKGWKPSSEQIKKFVEINKTLPHPFQGKHLSETHKQNISKGLSGFKRSEQTKRKMSKARSGSGGSNWKGGITPINKLIFRSYKYKEWRSAIFLRDNFTCQKCKQKGDYIEAHHIKPFGKLFAEARKYMPLLTPHDAAMIYSPLWDINNGKTLCVKCHNKTKKGRPRREFIG